ncbi:AAA family ATPase [Sulfidibacter corallicola]|uniref:Uncharacterized AAA domain-containing protein ycf46 n=1 Tax=Sulfidibacter corallicola TaxID=2818388 RepID=A0A8A4TXR1_SULCO|nr:AAA family ATPase [Sulfidibacter corallicola]QTD53884.1 AAA family ATPase [Sulfidibacter corallicola]
MSDLNDLLLLVQSRTPLIAIESLEEKRAIDLFGDLARKLRQPLMLWSVTGGLRTIRQTPREEPHKAEPAELLRHIRGSDRPSVFLLLDFHPYLEDPVNVRLIREIAQSHDKVPNHLVLLSPRIEIPQDLAGHTARFNLSLPDEPKLLALIRRVAMEWMQQNAGRKVVADKKAIGLLARNLVGLTASDAERLARKAIYDDGAITSSDLKMVQEAKYQLISQAGVLSFECDTAGMGDVGGLKRLKEWLTHRKAVFHGGGAAYGLEAPKGVMLLGVQGCGKSLAAKAIAGLWSVPLLRLDFSALFNKFVGETERNLRESLDTSEIMAPCVLWVDEIEKGLAGGEGDGGVSRRILGTLLTWMSEKSKPVFVVATSNDVTQLPPELLRKGRFDEIFFVDLPDLETRGLIFGIQLSRRNMTPQNFDLVALARHSDGFSGAEIEQAVVASIYTALARGVDPTTELLVEEIRKTRPLSVVMAEKIAWLRNWAAERTVPAN